MAVNEKYAEFRKEPINEKCIVFESLWGRSYSCNPAAFYEYIIENHPEYECVWFFNDVSTPIKGNAKKVERKSEEYYHYLATAKYFIYNANFPVSFVKRRGQVIVQTMHGTPFKTFGLDVREELPTEKEEFRVIKRAMIWDYIVAQGEFTKNMVWQWFRYDNAVLQTGYPRTDSLYAENAADSDAAERDAAALKESLGIPAGKKVMLYAPTWRDMDRFDMMLDLDKLRETVGDEYAILVRPHYFVAEFYKVPEDGSFVFDGGRVGKIEDLFPITDILITDYSSVMFDFVLTGKPMIFFAYDLDEYTKETRGGYFDISVEAPGTIAKTTEEVAEAVQSIDRHFELNGDRIEGFCAKYLTYENPDSSEKMYQEVFVKGPQATKGSARNHRLALAKRVLPKDTYKKVYKRTLRKMLQKK